jgi:hypothetical protein
MEKYLSSLSLHKRQFTFRGTKSKSIFQTLMIILRQTETQM